MKNKELYKLLKKHKSNSGFTLTELLVGLFMSIFVIGALGFGLMTVLATSQSENSKVKARTENSRALDFVSDEVRRARTIESFADNTNVNISTSSGDGKFESDASKTVVLALDIPEISDSSTLDTDSNATTKTERVIYYLKSNSGTNWKGPQVLYRWGPPLNADGSYGTGTWGDQALIDGINSPTVSSTCSTGTVTPVSPATPTGFYACLFLQDATKAYQPNKTLPNYNPYNTSQLFLTGQTKTASGRYDDTQTNDTQVVARAREALSYKTDANTSVTWAVERIGDALNCGGTKIWDMRTDFSNDVKNRETEVSDPDKNVTWIQTPSSGSKQPQPITINPDNPLEITSTAQGGGCTSTAPQPISHTIDFEDPRTFNGDHETNILQNSSNVKEKDNISAHERVHFFKQGFDIPTEYKGYDANKNGVYEEADGDQRSLGRFLYEKGLATPNGDPELSTTTFKLPTRDDLKTYLESSTLETYLEALSTSKNLTGDQKQKFKDDFKNKFKVLGNDQRIIAFEVGQTSAKLEDGTTNNPGFDLQDNIFVVTSDVFKKKFNSTCFGVSGC
jgi:Tfp pilus assembly protein PilW